MDEAAAAMLVVAAPRLLVYVGFFVAVLPVLGLARAVAASPQRDFAPSQGVRVSGGEQILVAAGTIAWGVAALLTWATARRCRRPKCGLAVAVACVVLGIVATVVTEVNSARGTGGTWAKILIIYSAVAYAIVILIVAALACLACAVRFCTGKWPSRDSLASADKHVIVPTITESPRNTRTTTSNSSRSDEPAGGIAMQTMAVI
ncbi:Hypothetical Protein FCC1311_071202 [Hondaea fermentalgiana]|uniref:Uncharacterized protein n=1 Tax=Hondaea fermentalgiana TaxID=2315210 RepID=A0A2R5GKR0_9STRA|nr:Hypothetical Protein FCC1311_071202 [Hondaea fermentalgiana]|eukprot:GBG30899.1 Hypothetical Protein FCC1311_071202 [Hondaea fermentalgiana]